MNVLVKFRQALALAAAVVATACAFAAQAQPRDSWPSKPIRFVVPFAAGGSIDVVARLMGRHLEGRLGQNVVVENRPGAGGTVGADLVARAAADGHTFLFTAQGPLVLNPFLMKRLPYNAETAFAPVTIVAEAPNVLVTNQAFPVSSFSDLLAFAKSNPDKMTFGTQGVGTTGHVTGELINQLTGLGLTHVAYQGFPPALTDVLAGRVGMMIGDTINLVPRIRSGQLRPIAIASARRSTVLPQVPTFAEAGHPEIVSGPWFAVLAPAGTGIEIRRKLSDEMRQILNQGEVQEKLKELGLEIPRDDSGGVRYLPEGRVQALGRRDSQGGDHAGQVTRLRIAGAKPAGSAFQQGHGGEEGTQIIGGNPGEKVGFHQVDHVLHLPVDFPAGGRQAQSQSPAVLGVHALLEVALFDQLVDRPADEEGIGAGALGDLHRREGLVASDDGHDTPAGHRQAELALPPRGEMACDARCHRQAAVRDSVFKRHTGSVAHAQILRIGTAASAAGPQRGASISSSASREKSRP